jgi:hypothetical protein
MSTPATRTAPRASGTGAHTGSQPIARRARSRVLRRYLGPDGAAREILARPAAAGTVLVVDRKLDGDDERLLAHLAADEPARNASLVCRSFLSVEPARRRCRALQAADEQAVPLPSAQPLRGPDLAAGHGPVVRGAGAAFQLLLVAGEMSIPALRWTCIAEPSLEVRPVSLREGIAALESYQPFCELTRRALARYGSDPAVSCSVLRAELLRVLDSPIVLNRGLREAVLEKVAHGEVSMSELAMRCGRLKRDCRGNTTGETSWLARRIGLLPEGGQEQPTCWVHSDVLALIARAGLGVAPREVELG